MNTKEIIEELRFQKTVSNIEYKKHIKEGDFESAIYEGGCITGLTLAIMLLSTNEREAKS